MAKKKTRQHYHLKRHTPGTAPGTLTAELDASPTEMQLMAYGPDAFVEVILKSANEIRDYVGKWPVIWINVDGLGNADTIATIGQIFNLHPLALEDTINVHQRPKTEDYEDHLFTVCRMINEAKGNELDLEQVAFFMGRGFVISFQERPGDCWNAIRDRIRRGASKKIRTGGADYLLYALLDSLVDDYFPKLESFGDHLDDLEEKTLERPHKSIMAHIQATKRALYTIRHVIWPLREALSQIVVHEDLVAPDTKIFLRDCQDHVIQLLDIVESYRERVSGLVDLYLSSLSNRLNEVMKVLAIITTIFMPLTFIAGIYGMNFENMPELHNKNGYFIIMALMGFIAVAMIFGFYRIGWLGGVDAISDDDKQKINP